MPTQTTSEPQSVRTRRGAPFAIALAATLLLGGCTAKEVGQALYNTGKSYCEQNPHDCGQGDTGKPVVSSE